MMETRLHRKERSETVRRERMENARVGYQVAANLTASEVQMIWARYNAMLLANSIVLAVIAQFLIAAIKESSIALVIIPSFMSLVGIVLCIFWLCMTERKTKISMFYRFSARKLEEKCLGDNVNMIEKCGDWLEKKLDIRFEKDLTPPAKPGDGLYAHFLKTQTVPMCKLGKVRTRFVSSCIICFFILLYIGLPIYGWCVLKCSDKPESTVEYQKLEEAIEELNQRVDRLHRSPTPAEQTQQQ